MAEIINFLDPNAKKEIQEYIASLNIIINQYKEVAEASIAVEKAEAERAKTEQQLIKNQIESEKLTRERLKTQEALTKSQDKAAAAIKKEMSAYEKLNNQYKEAAKKAKDLGAAVAGGNKSLAWAYDVANKEALKYKNQLDRINSKLGNHQSKVGGYFKSMVQFAGSLGLVTGGAALLTKGIDIAKQSIESIQTTSYKYAIVVGGLKEGFNSFLRGMASGGFTFKNLIQNFKDAVAAGQEYVALLDDLGNKQLALRVAESNAKDELLELQKLYKDNTKSNEVRIKAIDDYIAKEEELGVKRTKVATQAFNAEIVIASERSELSQAEIMDYISNYEAFSEYESAKNKEYEENQKKLQKIELLYGKESQKYIEESMRYNLEMINKPATEQELNYRAIIENMAQLNDSMRDRIVSAYETMKSAEQSASENTMKAATKRSTLIQENIKNEIKQREDLSKSLGEGFDTNKIKSEQGKNEADYYWNSYSQEWIKRSPELKTLNESELEKRKQEIETYVSKMQAEIEADKKWNLWDQILALDDEQLDKLKGVGTEIANSLFEIRRNIIDQQMDALEDQYDAEMQMAGENEVAKRVAEKKYEKEKRKIKREEAINDRNQSLFNITISTAENIAKAGLNPYLIAAYLALAAAETAVVMSAVPGYDKGSKSLPDGLLRVAEKRPEIIIPTKGLPYIQTTPLLTDKLAGSQVIGGAETEAVLRQAKNVGYDDQMQRGLDLIRDDIKKISIKVGFDNFGNPYVEKDSKNRTTYVDFYSGRR